MAVVVKDRACRQCGATFLGGPRAWYCPSCRLERRREADRKYKAHGTSRPIGSIDLCVVCGKPYTVNSSRQKYCPVCAPDAVRDVDQAQSRAWNEQNATPEYRRALRDKAAISRKCVICGTEFRPKTPSITCSPECSQELKKRRAREYEAEHRAEINARKKQKNREKLDAMTPEERAAYREKVNASARANYRRRKEKNS